MKINLKKQINTNCADTLEMVSVAGVMNAILNILEKKQMFLNVKEDKNASFSNKTDVIFSTQVMESRNLESKMKIIGKNVDIKSNAVIFQTVISCTHRVFSYLKSKPDHHRGTYGAYGGTIRR